MAWAQVRVQAMAQAQAQAQPSDVWAEKRRHGATQTDH